MKYINSRLGRTRNGFTLIELLVVISIIALLLSIMMPSLSRARQLAKRAICLSNMKQIGLGITMYSNNWDGKYPPQTWGFSGTVNYWSAWRDPLLPYLDGDYGVFTCPIGGKKRWGKNSYRMNPPPIRGGGVNSWSWKLKDFRRPGTFLLVEGTSPAHGGVFWLESTPPEDRKEDLYKNHPMLFGDTHAEVGLWVDLFNEGW